MTAARDVFYEVGFQLNDLDAIRWPISELVLYFNDAQREIVKYRPDASSVYVTATLAASVRQSLLTITQTAALNPYKLLDISRNMAGDLSVVRQIDRETLDLMTPNWPTATASTSIKHFLYDPRAPRDFHVYPPAATGAQVELLLSRYPTDIAAPLTSDVTYADVTGTTDVLDAYTNDVISYMLYKAFTKDSEIAESAAKAAQNYQLFAQSMGIEQQGTIANSPKPGVTV